MRSYGSKSPIALPGIRGVPSHRGPPKRALSGKATSYLRARGRGSWVEAGRKNRWVVVLLGASRPVQQAQAFRPSSRANGVARETFLGYD